MPELPEVERVRMTLEPRLRGSRIVRVRLRRADICSHRGSAAGRPALLEEDRIAALHRHGKQLAIVGESGRLICVHLGMTGSLVWSGATVSDLEHVHAVWETRSPTGQRGRLVFRDPRRFGGLWTFPSFDALRAERWSMLGPDALAITKAHLAEGLANSTRSIKAALLDQSVLAGVGNIYADEALHLAGISPRRQARRLNDVDHGRLASAIRSVLRRSIASGGSTIRDYRDGEGRAGMAQLSHAVYGRGGEPCLSCGYPLREALLAQRTTVWCPHCQH